MSCVKLCSEGHALDKGVHKLGRVDVVENCFD